MSTATDSIFMNQQASALIRILIGYIHECCKAKYHGYYRD